LEPDLSHFTDSCCNDVVKKWAGPNWVRPEKSLFGADLSRFRDPPRAVRFECVETALELTAVAGLAALEQSEGARLTGEDCGSACGLGLFDHPESHAAPVGNSHDFYEPGFDEAFGMEFLMQLGEEFDE
jgi:hypothetical protein